MDGLFDIIQMVNIRTRRSHRDMLREFGFGGNLFT